jgi:putative spermidine/putrescine transport system substrate-binding protein
MARSSRKQPSPAIHHQRTLRVLGTDISLLEEVRHKAILDLGFNIEFEVLDFPNCQRKAALNPDAYDIYDQCFHNLAIVWFWGALQRIDTTSLGNWSKVSSLTKSGGLGKYASRGFGDAPIDKLYVQPDHSLGPEETRYIAMLPTVHNFDSFGYDTRVFNTDGKERESWAMLFDPRARGKLALVDEPAIGLFDVALAAEAMGVLRFDNIGNMSPSEIAALFRFLKDKREEGFVRCCWRTGQQAAKLFRRGEVTIQSMWSPAYNELGAVSAVVKEAVPAEGYRAWHGGLSIARHVSGPMLRMACEYMDWWLSGWAGAVMARRGYYMSAPSPVMDHLSAAEWGYWYDGQEASQDLFGVDGETVIVRQGARRSGGSYLERARRIALWNTVMDEHNYAARAWTRFVSDVNGKMR